MKNHREKTLIGVGWSVIGQFGTQGISIIGGIILARMLSPNEFGTIAMVTVFTGYASIIMDFGFGPALIQKNKVTESDLSSVFWFNVFLGLILTFIICFFASSISGFYNRQDLLIIIYFLSLNFIINSLNIVQRTVLSKALDFKSLSLIDVFSNLIAYIIAIVFALYDLGVWSLVVLVLSKNSFKSIFLWLVNEWRPSFIFSWKILKEMTSFSLNLLGSRTLNYVTNGIDKLLIGKQLGSNPLGIYFKAYDFVLLPVRSFSIVLLKVFFPSFALIQEDTEKISRIFLKILRILAFIVSPTMIGMLLLADSFVITVFGEQWLEMILPLQFFCIMGLMATFNSITTSIYLATGKTSLLFRVNLIMKFFAISSIIIGINFGLMGVVIGRTISSCINTVIILFFTGRIIKTSLLTIASNILSSFIWTLPMIMVVILIKYIFQYIFYLNELMILILSSSIGAIFYIMIARYFKPEVYLELEETILPYLHKFLNKIRY